MAMRAEIPRPHRSSAHGHTQTLRVRNAGDALVSARDRFRATVAPDDAAIPTLWAAAVLAEDDRFGTASGLVVQGDGIGWRALTALEILARRGVHAHRQQDRHAPGVTPLTCPLCAAVFALDVRLVDGLRSYREGGAAPCDG